MKFGKQLKLQSVKDWQEHYMSYKRLKRIIKKLMVQLREAEERQLKEIHDQRVAAAATTGGGGGSGSGSTPGSKSKLSNDQLTRIGTSGSPPTLQSYSPTLSAQSTPTDEANGKKIGLQRGKSRLGVPSSDSPLTPQKGSPGLSVGADAYQEFFTTIENDLIKVNRFFALKYEELLTTFNQLSVTHERSDSISQKRDSSNNNNGSGSNSPVDGSKGSVAAVSAWMNKRRESDLADSDLGPSYGSVEQGGGIDDSKESDKLVDNNRTEQQHTISTSQHRKMEEKLEKLLDLYRLSLQLQVYSLINYEGLRKIVKKFDKNTGEEHSEEFVKRLDIQPFRDTTQINALIEQIEDLYTKINCRRPNQDIWSSQGMLRGVKREVDNPKEEDDQQHRMNWMFVLLAFAIGSAILMLPILPHDPRAKSCAALLGTITVLWVSEAVPFFVAALAIPFLAVMLGILADPTGIPLNADKASKAAFGFMFNDTIMLIIGGFSISAAFSKCNFELRLASIIQRTFGDSPKLFLLAFMMLGAFMSCWISNIAAPVLLTSLLLPIVRDFGSTSPYARSLLLGLAFSCNIGGMMSPISSPQNAIALGYLEAAIPSQAISFSQWLCVSVPFCILLVLITWAWLVFFFLGNESDVKEIPMIIFEKQPINRTQVAVMVVTGITIVLWCTLSYTKQIFGEMGTIAVFPAIVFFGTGILTKADLLGFSWNLILLIGGGNVLGAAVNSSQLLHIISQALEPYLLGHSAYITTVTVLLAVFLVTTHTHTHTHLPFLSLSCI